MRMEVPVPETYDRRQFTVDNPHPNDYNSHNTLKRRVKCDNMTEKGAGMQVVLK